MSILGAIFSKILGHPAASATPAAAGADAAPGAASNPSRIAPTSPAPQASPSSDPAPAGQPAAGPAGQPAAAPAGQPAAAAVDVGALLDGLAAKSSQKLDWKHSIVDMLKLLDLDSSLSARQALAEELHFGGDMHDSAAMNIWLHKQVIQKLAENGGKVPAELRA